MTGFLALYCIHLVLLVRKCRSILQATVLKMYGFTTGPNPLPAQTASNRIVAFDDPTPAEEEIIYLLTLEKWTLRQWKRYRKLMGFFNTTPYLLCPSPKKSFLLAYSPMAFYACVGHPHENELIELVVSQLSDISDDLENANAGTDRHPGGVRAGIRSRRGLKSLITITKKLEELNL